MSESLKLVAFCGSLRKASLNRQALHAFVERLPAGQAHTKFADGKLTDETTGKMLGDLGAALAFAVRQAKAAATVK